MNVHEDKILLLTSFATAAEAKLALDAGVLGAVVKDSPSETIIKAIRTTMRGEKFVCPIKEGTLMDMMYMPDALHAAISLMEADPTRLIHHNGFNVASMSFAPETIFAEIKKFKPEFEMEYDVDPLKQAIADSWPDRLDDSAARSEWDWQPQYDITAMTRDMLEQLSKRLL